MIQVMTYGRLLFSTHLAIAFRLGVGWSGELWQYRYRYSNYMLSIATIVLIATTFIDIAIAIVPPIAMVSCQ